MITPQLTPNVTDRESAVPLATAPALTPPAKATPAEARMIEAMPLPSAAEQHGSELAWASLILLGTLVLLVGIGLWIAVVANISIAAVLLGAALLVLVIVAVSKILDEAMLRPYPETSAGVSG